ncbi:MAG TPA: HDOD domain-containing protein [Polyangiaceae bacterium]|nr:HDOD domain-containing protein [Polyangiaceae bacterium]
MTTPHPVLVVEDDEGFREALRRWLEALGYDCILVSSAEDGTRAFAKQPLHAVLLDLHLPGRSGHVFLRQLRGINSTTPAIVVSGGAQIDDVVLALRHGAADFLRKPFRIDELAAALERATKFAAPSRPNALVDAVSAEASSAQLPTAPAGTEVGTQAARPTLATLIDHIRKGSVALPVLDTQVGRIARLLASPEVDVEELQALVESDANLSATLLRTANSAYYSRGNVTKTLREAFTRLGSRSALNVVTGAALQARLRVRGPLAELARKQWVNNVATSRFCGEIAKMLRRSDGERLQLFGLIHNLGELVFVHLASEFELGGDLESLAQQMSAAHEEAGLALVRSWRMSTEICRIVGHHHGEGSSDYDFENDRYIVLASWNLAIKCGFSYVPDQVGDPRDALAELGLTEDSLTSVCLDAKQWTFD